MAPPAISAEILMKDQTGHRPSRPSLSRFLALAALLAVAVWAFLLPAKPAHAMSPVPRCASGYSEKVLYYTSITHQTETGETDIDCAGNITKFGSTNIYYTYTCTACP
jgi:hypothetical protein